MIEALKKAFYQTQSFLHARRKFHDYHPQSMTWSAVAGWLRPYNSNDARLLRKLLRYVRYFSAKETKGALVAANQKILDQLIADGLGLQNVIYVQVHDAGSSSAVMLNLLRDSAKLERAGCTFIDANSRHLGTVTRDLAEGAIIYVDDFAGSGLQFTRVHREISQLIVGSFVEFFLAPCVAEEAIERINEVGVEVATSEVHYRKSRPLNPECASFPPDERERLLELSAKMYATPALGFRRLATMVVFARQCPNSVPLLLRGSRRQAPFSGLLPRTTDLPTDFPEAARAPRVPRVVEEVTPELNNE